MYFQYSTGHVTERFFVLYSKYFNDVRIYNYFSFIGVSVYAMAWPIVAITQALSHGIFTIIPDFNFYFGRKKDE